MKGKDHYSRRQLLRLACGAVTTSVLLGCSERQNPAATGAHSDITVFYNGVVLPVDDAFSEHQALVIQANKVLAVGSNEAMLSVAGAHARKIDLQGRTVLPGFIEPHIHFTLLAFTRHWHDVGPLKYETVHDVLDALSQIVTQDPGDDWVLACQFDPSIQTGPAMLTTKELDKISATRPIFILNASGHLAYMNSAVLALAGITRDTPNPPGAEYFRDSQGVPNGAMTQKAYLPVIMLNQQVMQSFTRGAVESGIQVAQEAAASGITTLCDMATGGASGFAEFENYQAMFATGRMKARIRAYLYSEAEASMDQAGAKPGQGDAKARIAGWKIVSDGSNQGFTGWQRAPYLHSDNHGIAYVPPEALKAMVVERAGQGWPLAIHGNGDAAIDSILDALEAASDAGIDIRALRCRIEHASILQDDHILRMRQLGVSPSFLINHVYFWGHTLRDNVFGPEKVQLLDRCASVEEAGIQWTMHSDAPVSAMGSLQKIRVAVARDLWKEPDTILAPDERVSVEAAIRAVTINAAWQCHSEHEIGSLAPGKLADLVVLESDPRAVEPTAIASIRVLETWMDGRRVYQA